jgi:hypothetical protein
VVDDFVLSAPSVDVLERASAYVARGLARRERSTSGVELTASRPALSGAMRAFVMSRWAKARGELELRAAELQRTSGRKADFAEPAAILSLLDEALGSLLDIVTSSRTLSFSLVPHTERLDITLELEPEERGAAWDRASTLRTGDLAPLESLPAASAVAALFRPSHVHAPPSGGANEPGATARALFGSRLSPPDALQLSAFLGKAAHAAPDARTVSLLSDRTFVYRERVLPGEAPTDLRAAVALLELPAFAQPFAALYGKLARPRELRVGDSPSRTERRALDDGSGAPSELAWMSEPGGAALAAGPSARTAVENVRSDGEKAPLLALEPSLRARHEPSAFALYAELSRLGLARSDAPVLLSLTRRSRALSLRFELSRGASIALLERTPLR